MTTLYITVGDREQVREEALEFVREVETGDATEETDRRVLRFGSYADLVDALPPRRLTLLRAIATDAPESIRETARLVDRDVSDVHTDLKRLEVLALVEFESGGPSGAMRPVVPFDRLEVDIDLPLGGLGDSKPATQAD
jgi:predicted transcriptional regulator